MTTLGDIDVELWSKEAPLACRNFVQLCMEGYYNGTIFHRIIKGDYACSYVTMQYVVCHYTQKGHLDL